MKKTYIFYFLVALFSFGYSQTIVTVDRANIVGPTTTGNDPAISSSGFVRGSGIALSTTAANFTSNLWNASSQAQAVTNNEYIEWTVTASASNSITVTGLDIRTRRNANGPENWQIFYSLDNFATAGVAATPVQIAPAAPDPAANFNFTPTITSGTAGTITFRLYAWNAATAGGWFRIANTNSWSAFGISRPGVRLSGTITDTSVNSSNSDIAASTTSYIPTDNIDYASYTTPSGLTQTNAIQIGEFVIRDGGVTLTDADALPTILTDLEFSIANSDNLAAIALFDGTTKVAEASVSSDTVTFSGITSLIAGDNGAKTVKVYATFKTTVTDNEQVELTITTAAADAINGSSFNAFDAGGASTPTTGDANRIEVTATEMEFGQQPTDTNQFEIMTPFPTVFALDSNGNLDVDFNSSVTVSATGPIVPNPSYYTMTNGIAVLDNIIFSDKQAIAAMLVYSPFSAVSDSFNIDGPLITIAQQDFDGTMPEWPYTTDVATFDNGWGVDGYYGVIDSAIAAPLDNPSFSGNIFGENDINDEGNGTTGFATITFDTIDISALDDVRLSFDWDVHGYANDDSDVFYTLIYDGVAEPIVYLLDGNGAIDTDQGTVSIDIPNSVNTIALQVSLKNRNDINGFTGFDNFKLVSVFDGLIHVDDGTFVGWKPSAPDSTTVSQNAYVISGEYTVGSDVKINNFYIKEGAKTNIASQQSITSNGSVINNGVLELYSTSTGYSNLITDNIKGEVIYNRHVNQLANSGSTTGNNDLISAPVTNADQTFLALRTANPDLPSGTIGGVLSFLFGPFDNNANAYINYRTADDTSLIAPGIGYRTASDTPTGSPFKFVGNVETGIVTVPITVGVGSIQNLIGNPYPSYLSLSTFLTENSSEFSPTNSGVYAYVGNVDDGFAVRNQAYSDANPTAKIAPGQGFFVASKSGGGLINFTPAMRTIGTTDDFISGRSADNNLAHLYLKVSKDDKSYQTALYFNDNASLSMDPGYDSELFETITPSFAIYSRLVEDNTGKDFAAQSVKYSDLENVTIPLGINTVQGAQAIVSISEHNIPDGTTVTLEDNVTNTFTNLLEGDYTFTPATSLTTTGRFYLHFGRTTLSLEDNLLNGLEIYTNANPKSIVVKGQLEGSTSFKLFDIQGRMVETQSLDSNDTEHSIDASNLSAGIYVVQLQNATGNRTQKVIIR